MPEVLTTKEKPVSISSRVGESGVPIVFTFVTSDGSAYNITGKQWEYRLKSRPTSENNVFVLTEGSGLEIQSTNKIILTVSDENASIRTLLYFGQLFSVAEDKTWVSTKHRFAAGDFASTDSIEVTVNDVSPTVNVTIEAGADTWPTEVDFSTIEGDPADNAALVDYVQQEVSGVTSGNPGEYTP